MNKQEMKARALQGNLKEKEVFVDEWGGSVLIKALSFAEQAQFAETGETENKAISIAKIVIMKVFDIDTKTPFFNKGDLDSLVNNNDGKVITKLFEEILKLSGIGEPIEAIEKN